MNILELFRTISNEIQAITGRKTKKKYGMDLHVHQEPEQSPKAGTDQKKNQF